MYSLEDTDVLVNKPLITGLYHVTSIGIRSLQYVNSTQWEVDARIPRS